MIVVRVELWSAITGDVSELARMTIDNLGTSPNGQLGDYRARTLRGRSREALDKALLASTVQRESRVLGHARLREHVWNLVAKALAGMAYGPAMPPSPATYASETNKDRNAKEETPA